MADSSIDALIAQVEATANVKDEAMASGGNAMSAKTKARLQADLAKAKATAKTATKAYQNTPASAVNYAQVKQANDSAINAINNIQDMLDKGVEPQAEKPSVTQAAPDKSKFSQAQQTSFNYAQTLQQTAEQEYNDFKTKLAVYQRGAANPGDKAELERAGKDYQATMAAIKSAYEKAGVVQGDVTLDQTGKLIEGTKYTDPTKPEQGTQVVSQGVAKPATTGATDSSAQQQQAAIPVGATSGTGTGGGKSTGGATADTNTFDGTPGFVAGNPMDKSNKLAGPVTPELLAQEQQNFVTKYGGVAAMALAHPWMTTILNQAIDQGWTGDKFTQTIQADPNWKNFDQHLRDYESAFYGNGQAWAEEYNKQLILLQNSAKAQGYDPSIFGAAIDTSNADNIKAAKEGNGAVNQYLKAFYGTGVPDQATFDRFVANHATMAKQADKTSPEGILATNAKSIRSYFQSMGINTLSLPSTWTGTDEAGTVHTINSSGDYATNLADAVQKGLVSMDTVQQTARTQAAQIFKPFANQINNGMLVSQLAQPYTSVAANLLEKSADSFTLGDYTGFNGKLTKALQGDGTNATPLDQFMTTVKSDPEWLNTKNARDNMMDTATSLLRSFGMVVG